MVVNMDQPSPTGPIWTILGMVERPRQNGSGWSARCPAHEDRDPSLSIKEGLNGKVLLYCHAGCTLDAICDALKIQKTDLFEKSAEGYPRQPFRLVDITGRTIARHIRTDLPNGDKDLQWERNGKRTLDGLSVDSLPLYGLPLLAEAKKNATVYVCEGEQAAQALIDAGVLAVGTVTGASGTPGGDVLAPLRDFKVVLWPDNDDIGRQHMERIAAVLNMSRPPYWLDWQAAPPKGDAADYFKSGGTVDGLADLVRAWKAPQTALAEQPKTVSWNLIKSTDLARLTLPEPKWAVPGIVPEGVFLVAGKPKFGKSWWVLDLCIAIATGGKAWGRIAVEKGDVLYITFEDSYRRLQDRQQRLIGHDRGLPGLDYVTECPRSSEGGIELVMDWVQTHPKARLMVIDPLEYWRPQEDSKKQLYRQDYDSLRPIVEAARSLGISVIILHHCNKMPNPDDPFDAISGTTGLQGVADAIGVFRKEHGMADAVLFLKGKDVDSAELAYKTRVRDPWPAPAWELLGSGEEYRLSRERFDTLEALWREPWQTPASLAELMDPPVQKGVMRKRLFDMAHDSLVRVSEGKYAAGVERDAYLDKYGHSGHPEPVTLLSNGNASNAVTPVHPHSISNGMSVMQDESVTDVPNSTVVPTVTAVTGPKAERRLCPDCGWETPGSWALRCESCQARRQAIPEVEELEI